MASGKVTERTFYPFLINIIEQFGGNGVSEVLFNSQPDIVFNFSEIKWLLSVKIGNDSKTLKDAFLQYSRHKDESGISYGVILFLPEEVRKFPPVETYISQKIKNLNCDALIDTPYVKRQFGRMNFPSILKNIKEEIISKVLQQKYSSYPLSTVMKILQQHVEEMMDSLSLSNEKIVKIITDKELLSNIGHTDPKSANEIARFLSAYILLSQILFLRLYSRYHKDVLPPKKDSDTKTWLREAFRRIREINYRPIYDLDVLGTVSESFATDTLDLIWGLEIERLKEELPGRIFHELMPRKIRKLLAAFYTRPQAADLLAKLTISKSDQTVFDPACGSGTILVSAYKRKLALYYEEGKTGNPHQKFCEEEIYGSDIMPFAVHLTGANLSSMDPSVNLNHHQIIQADSLSLSNLTTYKTGVQLTLIPSTRRAFDMQGADYNINLEKVDCILMNPPFTKVERGIRKYVNMNKYGDQAGYEVGLWGHFLYLAYDFLKEGGVLGAVLPINVLRGRESEKVRKLLFEKMTPIFIVKSSINYGFSEYSEYRDILFVATKSIPNPNHRVKYILIKQDINTLNDDLTSYIAEKAISMEEDFSELIDIKSISIKDLQPRFKNLMWFFSANDIKRRDIIENLVNKILPNLEKPPEGLIREGYRPVPENVSKFMFLTREVNESRTEMAFLKFKEENQASVTAYTDMGVSYEIEKDALIYSLRTGVGLDRMNISDSLDYVAMKPYKSLSSVRKAAGFRRKGDFLPAKFWSNVRKELMRVSTNLVILRRIGLSSPNQHLIAFYSNLPFSPSNTLNVITETDENKKKALAVIFNSIVFISQFFLLKEESASRWADIRFYDVGEMHIIPKDDETIKKLVILFEKYSQVEFPSLIEQMDRNFFRRYDLFWEERKTGRVQMTLDPDIRMCNPSEIRIQYDLDVLKALDIQISEDELRKVYCAISEDLIISRGLKRE
ncbi:MAG: HsdM family class I SAM-dependent methyltransferase [Thermoplasmata archaeon]|jgi:type I restriction-modification system DNA methylase subunit